MNVLSEASVLPEHQDAAHRGEAQDQSEDRGPFHSACYPRRYAYIVRIFSEI